MALCKTVCELVDVYLDSSQFVRSEALDPFGGPILEGGKCECIRKEWTPALLCCYVAAHTEGGQNLL